MLGEFNLFLNCLLYLKLLKKNYKQFSYVAVGGLFLIDTAGSIKRNRI